MRVDLPDPDGPIMARNSPSLIFKSIFFNAWVSSPSDLYIFPMFFNSMIFFDMRYILFQIQGEYQISGLEYLGYGKYNYPYT